MGKDVGIEAHGHSHGHEDDGSHGHEDDGSHGDEGSHGQDSHGQDSHGHGHGHGHEHEHGVGGWLRSLVRPHSHDPADSVDSALTASSAGLRALGLSLAGLGLTAAVQLAVVLVSGSVALLSDTVHNFADALTAVPLGLAFVLGRRPPNERYTYGYGRSEDLAGVFIVGTIAASCGFAAWEAITRLIHPRPVHQVAWVVVAGLVGFAGNEIVATYRMRVGRRIGSAALVADGMHARTDGLTSLAVVVGAVGVALGWKQADAVAGLVITTTILLVVKNAARDIYRRLMDAVDSALVTRTREVVAGVPGVEAVEAVRIRWVGHELRAEVEVDSGAGLTIAEGHAIAEEARHRLLHDVPRLTEATIHTSPYSDGGLDHHAGTAHHFRRGEGPRH